MDSTGHYIGGLPGGFSSTIFRMATKAYRQGRDTTTLLNLLSYRKMDGRLWGFVELHKVEPRISQGGSLLIREQKVYLIPSLQKTPLPWYGGFGICRHIPFMEMTDLYRWGIQVPGADELINGFENTQGIIYCQYCYSEFRVDFKGYGKAGNVLFITRWIDLGDGKEADDFKRRIRLYGSERRRRVTYQRGSIYAAFEQQNAEFKFESTLTKQDEKELTTRCWPWPDYANVSAKEVEIGYVVRSGRLVPKFQTRKRR
ncbi:hypothetical protein V491_02335 [Pseudogymnoascus sp. VKM F-3775]|nr:hypothetical protein V491_02335 [Pseudogymnoascus sp. VKM F-3775]